MNGKWSAGEKRPVYESDWMTVSVADTTMSDGTKFEHHFIESGLGGAGVVVFDESKGGVLLIWRHRLVGDAWGWELPGGRIEADDKSAKNAAIREVQEETGWKVSNVEELMTYQPINSFVDHPFRLFYSESAEWVGPGPDPNEVADLAWMPVEKLPELIRKGEISSGFTLTPLLYCLSLGPWHDHLHAEH